jgi:hypothetical protein
MKDQIIARLKAFEKEYGVEIILAVESGSRGWGFASEDSDYDVRFVYKHPFREYLTLIPPTKSHDWIEGEVDYEGYDIYKFYDLLLKSNMNIIDWVFQTNIYIDKMKEKERLKELILDGFSRKIYIAHNYGLCQKNYHKYFVAPSENEPTAKRYVYCIRALLSARYCHDNDTIAPQNFNDLIRATLNEEDRKEIEEMVELKKATKEKVWYKNEKWLQFTENSLNSEHLTVEDDGKTFGYYYTLLNRHLMNEMGMGSCNCPEHNKTRSKFQKRVNILQQHINSLMKTVDRHRINRQLHSALIASLRAEVGEEKFHSLLAQAQMKIGGYGEKKKEAEL